jgi:hypothetical protein
MAVSVVVAFAQMPAGGDFKSPEAKTAKKKFDSRLSRAADEYAKEVTAARKQFVLDLDAAMKLATKAADLDEALRIRSAKEAAEKEASGAAAQAQIPAAAASFRGHHYLAVLSPKITWTAARDICRKMGGDLASINDKAELNFLRSLNDTNNLFVGGRKMAAGWAWADGSAVRAELWHKDFPSDEPSFGFLYINGVDSIGNSAERSDTIPGFICEWPK